MFFKFVVVIVITVMCIVIYSRLFDILIFFIFFFFKQKTAYEMRISDWSSDVCSSDLPTDPLAWQADRTRGAATACSRERQRLAASAQPDTRTFTERRSGDTARWRSADAASASARGRTERYAVAGSR